MTPIETTIARIPSMSSKERATFRKNAETSLRKRPEYTDAQRLLDALDAFDAGREKASELDVTGLLSWEKHRAGQAVFRAFHQGVEVGRIFKRADHSLIEKDVYSMEIGGIALAGAFHHIRDAREAGERAYAAQYEDVVP